MGRAGGCGGDDRRETSLGLVDSLGRHISNNNCIMLLSSAAVSAILTSSLSCHLIVDLE